MARHPGPSRRRRARLRALDVLYESDLRGLPLGATLEERLERADPPLDPYVTTLVRGVAEHQDEIDGLLAEHAHGWTLPRMPPVDRNVLRLGVFELLHQDDVPDDVVLSEATDLVADLSTPDSPGFVNGLLGRIRDGKPASAPPGAAAS